MADDRLIFVSLQGAVPRRKVAVPVPDGMTWDEFVGEVAARLKLGAVGDLVMATTGARVTSLDTLQDIDELYAVDGGGGGAPSSSAAPLLGAPRGSRGGGHRVAAADTEITPADNGGYGWDGAAAAGGGSDDDDKYALRTGAATRALARLFPALVPAASLPLTRHDVEGRRGRRGGSRGAAPLPPARARRRGRALLALVAAAVALLLVANVWWGPGALGGVLFGGGAGEGAVAGGGEPVVG